MSVYVGRLRITHIILAYNLRRCFTKEVEMVTIMSCIFSFTLKVIDIKFQNGFFNRFQNRCRFSIRLYSFCVFVTRLLGQSRSDSGGSFLLESTSVVVPFKLVENILHVRVSN